MSQYADTLRELCAGTRPTLQGAQDAVTWFDDWEYRIFRAIKRPEAVKEIRGLVWELLQELGIDS